MKSQHFKLEEFIPKGLIDTIHGDLLWSMVDPKLVESVDKIKEVFSLGTATINSYRWGGGREWSGIRTKDSKYYSEGSMHSVGKAVDMVFSAYPVDAVRTYILENQDTFPGIGGIELGVSWLHVDTRDRVDGRIVTFNP